MWFFIIVGAICCVIFILSVFMSADIETKVEAQVGFSKVQKLSNWAFVGGLMVGLTTLCVMLGLICYDSKQCPTTLDVYRGKTELKINGYYKDSTFVPKDSIVIFKEKYEY